MKTFRINNFYLEPVSWNMHQNQFIITDDKLFIFYLNQEEITSWPNVNDVLSSKEIVRFNQYIFLKDKLNFLSGKFLVKKIVSEFHGINLLDVSIEQKDIHSKPFINIPKLSFYFNISHTGTQIIVAASLTHDIGIDIEEARYKKGLDLVVNSYFTKAEASKIENAINKEEIFKTYWTRKEAIVKLLGIQLLDQVKNIEVSKQSSALNLNNIDIENNLITMFSFKINDNTMASVACFGELPRIEFIRLAGEDLNRLS